MQKTNISEGIKHKNALVVEGGAMRGIFATGILDVFLEKDFNPFGLHIGVSAGSTNIAAYLAKMIKRNYKVFTDYSIRPDFISWKKFLSGGHLVDLDWLWDITIKELRLDLKTIINSEKIFLIGVTEVETGRPIFLEPNETNLEEYIKASSALPIFYRNFIKINNKNYVDGGVADPIPVIEAYKRGAKNIMVIRSRPFSYNKKIKSSYLFLKLYFKKYPNLYKAMLNRGKAYQEAINFIRKPPKEINIIEVNPPDDFKTKRLTRDKDLLDQDYIIARKMGFDLIKKWNRIYK
ncbi:MAG: patatin family protein [Eubacteriales bacterium]